MCLLQQERDSLEEERRRMETLKWRCEEQEKLIPTQPENQQEQLKQQLQKVTKKLARPHYTNLIGSWYLFISKTKYLLFQTTCVYFTVKPISHLWGWASQHSTGVNWITESFLKRTLQNVSIAEKHSALPDVCLMKLPFAFLCGHNQQPDFSKGCNVLSQMWLWFFLTFDC